ncbi:hypothetical protein LJ756_06505 [Arthrobacter sp. zg-Y411]|uniref:hypothetical protein n=1 Tax=Arthrobacter zhangbolii TaxID=2886936 RepID=UPI001D1553AB|nr:hypothetical protein [Arthrobacter zhangbolii]MCC3294271.1 hypothetical protein [Arthrobacter zhangbolii]
MTIRLLLNGTAIPIDEAVFTTLFDNSVAATYAGYAKALESKSIKFADLVDLSRKGDIPYSLFFAPLSLVETQVATKTKKLLAGVSKDSFSIGSREKVELRDVELIIKDLIRKQELLKKHDRSLERNKVVGMLHKPGTSAESDATRLMAGLGLSHEAMRECRKMEDALDLLIERLEANQVLVSRSVQHYMPQRLTHVQFSGITIRDNKVPFIFLAGGDHGDYQEPVGRTIFTLTLMAVLVARRIFAPVTWDGQSAGIGAGREYDIVGAMLMPATRLREIGPTSLSEMKALAAEFKVTASAVTVRAMRLGIINGETATSHLDELRIEFGRRPQIQGMNPIKPENAVRKYSGRELSSRMLRVLDAGQISQGDFCRVICLNKLKPAQIMNLREALG